MLEFQHGSDSFAPPLTLNERYGISLVMELLASAEEVREIHGDERYAGDVVLHMP